MYFAEYDSPVGKLLLCSSGKALTQLRFCREDVFRDLICREEDAVLAGTRLWLDAYFRGEVPGDNPPLAPEGTAFQMLVWQLLLEVPYGAVCTYGELARKAARALGKEKMSAQAIGQAVGSNPISILIPCHRCLGSGGRLTGYAWGIEKKKWLLDLEAGKTGG